MAQGFPDWFKSTRISAQAVAVYDAKEWAAHYGMYKHSLCEFLVSPSAWSDWLEVIPYANEVWYLEAVDFSIRADIWTAARVSLYDPETDFEIRFVEKSGFVSGRVDVWTPLGIQYPARFRVYAYNSHATDALVAIVILYIRREAI